MSNAVIEPERSNVPNRCHLIVTKRQSTLGIYFRTCISMDTTDLSVTLHYLAGKITNYRIGFTAEKLTPSADSEHQDTLVVTVPRFAPSAVMLISTIVNNTQAPGSLSDIFNAYVAIFSAERDILYHLSSFLNTDDDEDLILSLGPKTLIFSLNLD
jgi:hypothetical protein